VLDSTRVDRVNFDGRPHGLTPFLASLAKESTVYERAYAPSSWTIPVVASLMTGQYPSEHRVTSFLAKFDKATSTLAELLAQGGYATSGVGANASLIERNGFARGFERYQIVGEATIMNPKSDGSLVIEQALRWVDEVGTERPHFLYLHFMDSHMPYRFHEGVTPPPPPGARRTDEELTHALVLSDWNFNSLEVRRLRQLYDGEVQHQDALLRDFFAELGRRGILEKALVVVVADHGEEFGEDKLFGHGASLHETLVHVPLLIRYPGRPPARVREPVQIGGLTAAILGVAGVRRPASVSIDPIQLRDGGPPPVVFTELVESGQQDTWLHKQAVVTRDRKLLVRPNGTRIAYDLRRDPFERKPTAPFESLEVALTAHLAGIRVGTASLRLPLDPATRERLRAVGYLAD